MIPGVVITGIGHVGPTGAGLAGLRDALAAGKPRLSEVDRSAGYHRGCGSRMAALVGELDLSEWIPPRAARRMSLPSRWCLAAARMALAAAEIPGDAPLGPRTGVLLSTTFGTTGFTEILLRDILLKEPQAASPFYFAETVANAPTAQVAIGTGATGTNETVTQREVGDLIALGRAAAELRRRRCDRVLAGVYDEIHPLVHGLLDRFRALARPTSDGDERARPFDRRRDGYLAGEGATVVLVEREDAARERGVPILARILGAGEAFDPTASAHGWGTGASTLAAGLHRTLDRAGISPDAIDRVVSGASGSIAGDRLEAAVLHELRPELPPILAPRGVTGLFGGGFLAATLLAARNEAAGPTAGFGERDPELGIEPHSGKALPPPSHLLVSSPAAGGAAAWLVLGAA